MNVYAFSLAKKLVIVTNQNYNFQPINSLLSSLNEKEHCCMASTFNVLGEDLYKTLNILPSIYLNTPTHLGY
jgi:hypothetical protein